MFRHMLFIARRIRLAFVPGRRGKMPITIKEDGFCFYPVNAGRDMHVRWSDIRGVFAARIDAVVISDLISIGILAAEPDYYIAINQFHPEFQPLMSALEHQLIFERPFSSFLASDDPYILLFGEGFHKGLKALV
jgi:hypothetical protein